VARKQARRQRHARESTTRAKVGDLAATVGDQALNVRSSDKRVKQVSRCAFNRITDAREVDCRIPCIEKSKMCSDDRRLGRREFGE
jgi:hypothetical protein